MTLGTAAEEIKRSDELWDNTNFFQLREQQEKSFGYYGPYQFSMDKKQGKWDDVTTNAPKIKANRLIGLLANSWMQLFIDVDDETRKKRQAISVTEKFANGCISAADRKLTSVPSGKSIQSALSSFAAIKGGDCSSVLFYEDKDGEPVSDLRVYDPTYIQWIEGEGELLWVCHRAYQSKEFIERTYRKQIEDGLKIEGDDTFTPILVRTFWDDKQWKVVINKEYVDDDKHNLGYIPFNIRSCGAVPNIQSEKYQDAMKWAWQNVFGNDWDIIDLESKLLSIESTKALQAGRNIITGEWDSVKSAGKKPEGIEKIGSSDKLNEVILFDAAQGQKFGGMVQPPSNEVVDQFLSRITGMKEPSLLDPAIFRLVAGGGNASLAAELRATTAEVVNPFRQCVEASLVWLAEESVRQFKNGDFGEIKLTGRDYQRKTFITDIYPKDIEEHYFECHLVPDRLRDEIQELGAAVTEVDKGLNSRRGARVKHNIVNDPDETQDQIDEELASRDPVFQYRKLALYFHDQGEEDMAQYYMAQSAILIKATVDLAVQKSLIPAQAPGNGQTPISFPLSPQAQVANIASQGGQIAQNR